MTQIQEASMRPWPQFRYELLTAREARRKEVIAAVRRFVEADPMMMNRRPRRKAVIEARLQLREDLVAARFQFRRAAVCAMNRLVSAPELDAR